MASRLFPLYNIDHPVGPGRPNKQDDVRLVQALFIEASRFDVNDWLREVPPQSRALATTGQFDGTLANWILTFQGWAARSFGRGLFKVDGIVDPMPFASSINLSVTFKSGRHSTLGFLCNRVWRYDRNAYMRIGDVCHVPWVPQGWDT